MIIDIRINLFRRVHSLASVIVFDMQAYHVVYEYDAKAADEGLKKLKGVIESNDNFF